MPSLPIDQRAIKQLEAVTLQFPNHLFPEATRLAASGVVQELLPRMNGFKAKLRDGLFYRVSWRYESNGGWHWKCSCRQGKHCVHALAVAMTVLTPLGDQQPASPAVSQGRSHNLPPPKTAARKPSPVAAIQTPRPMAPAKPLRDEIPGFDGTHPGRVAFFQRQEQLLGRPLMDTERQRLGACYIVWEDMRIFRRNFLSPNELKRLVLPEIPGGKGLNLLTDPASVSAFLKTPDAFFDGIMARLQQEGLPLAGWLQPWNDPAKLGKRVKAQEKEAAVDRWKKILGQVRSLDETNERPWPALLPRFRALRWRWSGGNRFGIDYFPEDEADAQSLASQLFAVLFELSAADVAGLESPTRWLLQAADKSLNSQSKPELTEFATLENSRFRRMLALLLQSRDHATLVVRPDGTPFPIQAERLQWALVKNPPGMEGWRIELVFPDGRPCGPLAWPAFGPPPMAIIDGEVWSLPGCLDPAGQQYAAQTVPEEILDHPVQLRALEMKGTRLPEFMARKIKRYPLQPEWRLGLWGRNEDGRPSFLRATLEATESTMNLLLRYQKGQWFRIHPEILPEEIGNLLLDMKRAEAECHRLASLKTSWDSRVGGYIRGYDAETIEAIVDWLATVPPDVKVTMDKNLAGLVEPPIEIHYQWNIQPREHAQDWFDVQAGLTSTQLQLTQQELDLLLRTKQKCIHLGKLGWRRVTIGVNDADRALMKEMGIEGSGWQGPVAGAFHALHLAGLLDNERLSGGLTSTLRDRLASLRTPLPEEIRHDCRAELRPYQADGLRFLTFLARHGLGGILADDMGLGKTIQTLAWLSHLHLSREADGAPLRALVVCPKSVVNNWRIEAGRFTPGLSVAVFQPSAMESPAWPDGAVTVANYSQLRLHREWFAGRIWDAVVLDEGQFIKNPQSQTSQAARALRARHRLVLTGTPVENRILDLWSIFSFALPELLGSQTHFMRLYGDKGEASALSRLRHRVRHFLLRRTKQQVAADLPARTEEELACTLEGEQHTLYQAELKRARQMILKVENQTQFNEKRFSILQSILRLRQICCDPRLIQPDNTTAPSAKREALFERLEELREEGHKCLVFSQFTSVLKLLREECDERGWDYLVLTGETEDRQALVDRFQGPDGPGIFFLSLKAGGFGLNLTAASYVFLYDPWWNPAVEAQAIDRTHRIGQRNPVIAYRLMARDTIEEKIRALQKDKAALARTVVAEESLAEVLDLAKLRAILGVAAEEA